VVARCPPREGQHIEVAPGAKPAGGGRAMEIRADEVLPEDRLQECEDLVELRAVLVDGHDGDASLRAFAVVDAGGSHQRRIIAPALVLGAHRPAAPSRPAVLGGQRRRFGGPGVRPGEALDSTMAAMYTYIVDRTQIYLTAEESAALERASIATGKTKSQLIREAIDEKYGTRPSLEEFLAVLDAAAGIWSNPEGEAAVKAIHAGRRAETRRTRQRMRLMQGIRADDEIGGVGDAAHR
jgi:hypothetical protein